MSGQKKWLFSSVVSIDYMSVKSSAQKEWHFLLVPLTLYYSSGQKKWLFDSVLSIDLLSKLVKGSGQKKLLFSSVLSIDLLCKEYEY